MSTRLNRRIVEHLDFTNEDEALLALVDMVKCPLALDTADNMIIFNSHCYDNFYFEVIRTEASDRIVGFQESGYRRNDRRCTHMKDPRTGEEFEYNLAMRTLYFQHTISRYKLKRLISSRVDGLTVPEAEIFLPGNALQVNINEFVKCIERKHGERLPQIEIYEDYRKNQTIHAQRNLQAQVDLPHSWVEPPFPDPAPPPPPPPDPSVPNPNAHASPSGFEIGR